MDCLADGTNLHNTTEGIILTMVLLLTHTKLVKQPTDTAGLPCPYLHM